MKKTIITLCTSLLLSLACVLPVLANTVGPGLHWSSGSTINWGAKKAWAELSGYGAEKKVGACVERCSTSGWVSKNTYAAYAEHSGWIWATARAYYDYR